MVRDCMATYGCLLQAAKCHICVPALRGIPEHAWPAALHEAAAMGFTIDHTSIPLLGSDAAAMHAVTLAADASGLVPVVSATADRANKACQLISCCLQLAQSGAGSGGRWPALCITRDIACRALTYDARVLPCSLVLPHARAVSDRAWEVFIEVIGEPLSDEQRCQAYLPTTLGGLSWPDLPAEVILGRLAGVIEIGPNLRKSIRERNPNANPDDIHRMDGVDLEPDLLDSAAKLGVVPGPAGLPAAALTKDPRRAPEPPVLIAVF